MVRALNIQDALSALKDAMRAEIRAELRAEVRAELLSEMRADDIALGKRLINKRQVWLKLGRSEDSLDDLRRLDRSFPAPHPDRTSRRLMWREADVDAWIDRT